MELAEYLKTLTPKQREEIAKRAKTTVAYLYQIAGGHRDAGTQLAKRLDAATSGNVTKHELRPDVFDQPQ